jgi:hypothetical protein
VLQDFDLMLSAINAVDRKLHVARLKPLQEMAKSGEFVSGGRFVQSSILLRAGVKRLVRGPRNQTAADHKREQDGKKDSKFQIIGHTFLRRLRFTLDVKPRQFAPGRG